LVQQTHDKFHEADDSAKYDKRSQLMDKLKRHGYPTDTFSSNSNI